MNKTTNKTSFNVRSLMTGLAFAASAAFLFNPARCARPKAPGDHRPEDIGEGAAAPDPWGDQEILDAAPPKS